MTTTFHRGPRTEDRGPKNIKPLLSVLGPLSSVLCLLSAAALLLNSFQPSFNPLPDQCWDTILHNTAQGNDWGSRWCMTPRVRPGCSVRGRRSETRRWRG